MICKNCKTENPDDAEFCLNCGKRLRTVTCPYCGAENREVDTYCRSCGKRLDGKLYCLNCGNEIPENSDFCIKCGAKVKKNDVVQESALSKKVTKIFRILSYSFAIVLASLSIIFSIFVGVGYVGDGASALSDKNMNLFYFFGDVYSTLTSDSSWVAWVMAILSTVICAATLIATVTFAIIAIVRCGKTLAGKNSGGGNTAVKAFMTYVIGATCLLMIWGQSEKASMYGESFYMAIRFNGVTTAGFAVGGAFTALYAVFAVLSNGKKQLNKSFIINGSLCIGSLVVSLVTAILLSLPTIRFSAGTSIDYGGEQIGMSPLMMVLLAVAGSEIENEIVIIIFLIVSYLSLTYAAFRAIGSIVTEMGDLTDGSSQYMRGSLGVSIEVLVTCVLSLVMTIVSMGMLFEDQTMTCDLGILIGLVVLGVISLGLGIARKVCLNKFRE